MTERTVNNAFDNFKNKLEVVKAKIRSFATEFFNYNYASTISLFEINDYFTNVLCNQATEAQIVIESLEKLKKPVGYPSLSNALNVCFDFLQYIDLLRNGVDIVIFYFNENSYDRINFNEILDNYIDFRFAINVLTFESPFEYLRVWGFLLFFAYFVLILFFYLLIIY